MKIFKPKTWLALSAALALAAAACGDDSGDAPVTTEATTTTAAETTTMADDQPEETTTVATTAVDDSFQPGPLGAVEVAPGEQIQIRSSHGFWGNDHSEDGRGGQLAVQDYGPIKGRTVNIGPEIEEMCSAESGVELAQTITADPKVVAVLGPSCSVTAEGAMPLISEAGMVMISGSTDAPDLTSDLQGNPGSAYRPGFYRVAHNGLHGSESVAAFLRDGLGLDRAAVITQDDLWTSAQAEDFRYFFERFGGEVTYYVSVHPDETLREKLDPILDEVVDADAQAIFIPMFPDPEEAVVTAAHHHVGTTDIPLVLTTLADRFAGMAESAGIYFTDPDRNFDVHVNEITGRNGHDVRDEYRDTFGETITAGRYWATGYDAATMLLAAIDRVAVERGGSLWIDRQALREALDATDFQGITGHVICDEFGDCGHGVINILHHEEPDDFEGTHNKIVYTFEP